jgi:hypothetical protein
MFVSARQIDWYKNHLLILTRSKVMDF